MIYGIKSATDIHVAGALLCGLAQFLYRVSPSDSKKEEAISIHHGPPRDCQTTINIIQVTGKVVVTTLDRLLPRPADFILVRRPWRGHCHLLCARGTDSLSLKSSVGLILHCWFIEQGGPRRWKREEKQTLKGCVKQPSHYCQLTASPAGKQTSPAMSLELPRHTCRR